MTEKWRYFLCTASSETFAWLGWPRKMAVPSPLGDVKIVSPISTFVLNTLTLKKKVHFYFSSKAFVIYDHKSDMFFKIVGFAGKRILLPPSLPSPLIPFFCFFFALVPTLLDEIARKRLLRRLIFYVSRCILLLSQKGAIPHTKTFNRRPDSGKWW